jgi:hypothetical protein
MEEVLVIDPKIWKLNLILKLLRKRSNPFQEDSFPSLFGNSSKRTMQFINYLQASSGL